MLPLREMGPAGRIHARVYRNKIRQHTGRSSSFRVGYTGKIALPTTLVLDERLWLLYTVQISPLKHG